jgi:TRAP-type C4-dicarboxylate transport system permease small subunit
MTNEAQGYSGKAYKFLIGIITFFAALNLFCMMMLTAVSVIFRYMLNSPIAGDTELVQFMMAIFVPFSILVCLYADKHVAVDLIVERLPERIQNILGIFTNAIMMAFYVLVSWQSASYCIQQFHSNLTSAVLLIPVYPFIVPLVIMGAVIGIILLQRILLFNLPGVFRK